MSAVRALREKLGDDAMSALHVFVEDAGRRGRDDVLTIAGDRFERRLTEEMGGLRVEMAQQFADLRAELLKWSCLFWIGQLAAVGGVMAFLLKMMVPR
jgi:hypothetical protein